MKLLWQGIKDPVAFDYMDAPETDKIVAGMCGEEEKKRSVEDQEEETPVKDAEEERSVL